MVSSDVLEYLKEYHSDEKNALKGREICTLFNVTSKQVRNIVNDLRQNGEPICSSNYGYWYSKDPEDLEATIARLSAQVVNMEKAIEGLRKAKGGKG